METFEAYCRKYLQQWEDRCAIRTVRRTRVSEVAPDDPVFPAAMQPLVRHPEVLALGPAAVREVLVRTAYAMQAGLADAEVDVVAVLCGRLANGRHDFPLPPGARQVALAIGTDEYYHALVAREFIEDLAAATGLEPGVEARPEEASNLQAALAFLHAEAPADIRPVADIVALCFAEHYVTERMFGLAKETRAGSAFQQVTREHLMDEGRHQRFFEVLLRHLWAEIGEDGRLALGGLLPGFFDRFLASSQALRAQYRAILQAIGFSAESAAAIFGESFAPPPGAAPLPKHAIPPAAHCLDLVTSAGLLAHAPTRDRLVAEGWVAADPVAPAVAG